MLQSNDKKKIENYIDKIIESLRKDARKSISSGMSDKQVINKITITTVNKFTPESKMILSSTYNMLMEKTLAGSLYLNAENKAAFYQLDILKDLNSKFVFDIPDKIDYQESKKEFDKWVKCGAVVVVGGIVSIPLKSLIPIGIAVIIAVIMAIVLKDDNKVGKTDISAIIDNYLSDIKKSVFLWIESVEKYYDEKIAILEKGMKA